MCAMDTVDGHSRLPYGFSYPWFRSRFEGLFCHLEREDQFTMNFSCKLRTSSSLDNFTILATLHSRSAEIRAELKITTRPMLEKGATQI